MWSSFRRYLATRAGLVAFSIVLAFGITFSYFVTRTLVEPLPWQYQPDFEGAQWIEMPTPAAAGYFRKTLYISQSVERAWIELSATGSYALYVNNIQVDHSQFPCVRLSGAYDLTPLLSAGKNVIAIHVTAGMYPGPPQILVRGGYKVADSPIQEFLSDLSWKVSGTPDGILRSYAWSSPKLEDVTWRNAERAINDELFSTVQPLAFDPLVFQDIPRGKWIVAPRGGGRQVSFKTDLQLPNGYPRAWLRVAATAAYDVLIDDHLAAMTPIVTRSSLFGPQAPVELADQVLNSASMPKTVTPLMDLAGSETLSTVQLQKTANTNNPPASEKESYTTGVVGPPSIAPGQPMTIPDFPSETALSMPELPHITTAAIPPAPQLVPLPSALGSQPEVPVLVVYDISNYLRGGKNSIVVRVRSSNQQPLLMADGDVRYGNGDDYRFGTDARWLTNSSPAGPSDKEPALAVAAYGAAPWGPLPRVVSSSKQWLPGADLRSIVRWAAVLATVVAIVFLLWLIAAALCAFDAAEMEALWTRDAVLHLPLLVGLLALLVLSFDVRIAPDYCFRGWVVIAVAALLAASKFALLGAIHTRGEHETRSLCNGILQTGRLQICLLLCVVAAGLAARACGLLNDPMSDEIALMRMTQGIFKRGVPFIQCGSFREYAASYELLPYPLALSSLFLGQTVLAYRLPALLFGGCSIALIGWVGYRMMGWRVGLVAAFIYAFLPTTVNWARDGFYPSEEGFMTLATFWFFYEAIRGRELNLRFLGFATVTAILCYLTWEGSGFLLPTLFVTIVVLRWGDFRWITDTHLWRCFIVVFLVVIVELSYRKLVLIPDYLGAVKDLTEVSGPQLIFLDRILFDPLYYLRSFFFVENQVLLTVLCLLGIVFARRVRPLRYLFVALVVLEVLYTSFLANYALRYCYYWTSLLVLAGVGSFFYLWDEISSLAIGTVLSVVRSSALWTAAVTLMVNANPFVMKAYRMSWGPTRPVYFTRLGAGYRPDFLSADRYIAQHLAPGDAVVVTAPHVFLFDANRLPDYWNDTILLDRIYYDGGLPTPVYIDKWIGVPAIRSLKDLKQVRAAHARTWLVQPTIELNSPEVIAYLQKEGKVVHEGFHGTVTVLDGAGPPEM